MIVYNYYYILDTSDGNSSRRDSNTSTLSSYMSSLRSDSSPQPFSSTRSSRQSSQVSSDGSSRFSIINSPYEYDISGNLPSLERRDSISSNISSMCCFNTIKIFCFERNLTLSVKYFFFKKKCSSQQIGNYRE